MLCITNHSIKNQSFVYTQLNNQTVLILKSPIESKSFVYTQFKCQTVLFDLFIGPIQMLPLRAIMDLGAMAMKRYSTLSKAPALLEPRYQFVLCHTQDSHCWWGFYSSAEMRSMYSTAPADWTTLFWGQTNKLSPINDIDNGDLLCEKNAGCNDYLYRKRPRYVEFSFRSSLTAFLFVLIHMATGQIIIIIIIIIIKMCERHIFSLSLSLSLTHTHTHTICWNGPFPLGSPLDDIQWMWVFSQNYYWCRLRW